MDRSNTDWTSRIGSVCAKHLSPHDKLARVPVDDVKHARCETCNEPAAEAVVVMFYDDSKVEPAAEVAS